MSEAPWVRFFASDWLAGTRGLSAAETGVYITLVASMYERGEPVPEDHHRLARICGASVVNFRKLLDALVNQGKVIRTEAGLWNDRVGKECGVRSEKSSVARESANARWHGKPNKKQRPSDANAMPTQSERNANQNQNQSQSQVDVGSSNQHAREFSDQFWPRYPHKVGKPRAQASFIRARRRAELGVILAGLDRYLRDKPADRPWCNPETWLNQERWADQPAPVLQATGPPRQNAPRRNGWATILETLDEPPPDDDDPLLDLAAARH